MFILFETLENSRISETRTHWSISSLGLWWPYWGRRSKIRMGSEFHLTKFMNAIPNTRCLACILAVVHGNIAYHIYLSVLVVIPRSIWANQCILKSAGQRNWEGFVLFSLASDISLVFYIMYFIWRQTRYNSIVPWKSKKIIHLLQWSSQRRGRLFRQKAGAKCGQKKASVLLSEEPDGSDALDQSRDWISIFPSRPKYWVSPLSPAPKLLIESTWQIT